MAHESCKSQIAVLEMNGQSVPQTNTHTNTTENNTTAPAGSKLANISLSLYMIEYNVVGCIQK